MKAFPSIPYWSNKNIDQQVIAFDKLDGSNIRFEWSKKRGWYKFGTRRTMIDENHPDFGKAITLFKVKYADQLDQLFRKTERYRNTDSFVVFCEYLGPNSFAGYHDPNDQMDIILIDVSQYKRGFLPPKEFVDNFSHLHIPNVIYNGDITMEFVNDIKQNRYQLSEGVICKGSTKTKGQDLVWMLKIKTNDWLDRLKNKFGEEAYLKEIS